MNFFKKINNLRKGRITSNSTNIYEINSSSIELLFHEAIVSNSHRKVCVLCNNAFKTIKTIYEEVEGKIPEI